MTRKLPEKISIGHGSGGKMTRMLVEELFIKEFGSVNRNKLTDSYISKLNGDYLSYTTDSYVVDPIIFPGGDIGKLAVCGTVNDLAVSGAKPLFLSAGFIIEEGLETGTLRMIVRSMAEEAKKAGVQIVTGDTKVVNRGKCDKVFINTSGIGLLNVEYKQISTGENIQEGDKIIINGSLGDHSLAILAARSEFDMETDVRSDCASLNRLIAASLESGGVKFMRDATRGGLATVLVELAGLVGRSITLNEKNIPLSDSVEGICEVLGFDPLYLANEGKVVMIVSDAMSEKVLKTLRSFPEGKDSQIIGEIGSVTNPGVKLITSIGGQRTIDMLASDQLPRIC